MSADCNANGNIYCEIQRTQGLNSTFPVNFMMLVICNSFGLNAEFYNAQYVGCNLHSIIENRSR